MLGCDPHCPVGKSQRVLVSALAVDTQTHGILLVGPTMLSCLYISVSLSSNPSRTSMMIWAVQNDDDNDDE